MSEKATERMVPDDPNSAAVDAWRHPVEAIPDDTVLEPQAKAEPKEPAKEPEKKK